MPRTTATLASLLLMAVAIGVNTARYPIVWQMAGGSNRPGPSAESIATRTAALPVPPPTLPVPPVANPAPPSPVPPSAKAAPVDPKPQVAKSNPSAKPRPNEDRSIPIGHIVNVRPVVRPVRPVMPSVTDVPYRLPPVDQVVYVMAESFGETASAKPPKSYPVTSTP